MFISPVYGSALFLCEILSSLPIEPDESYCRDGCGSCQRCVNACPNRCIDPETRTIQADHCAAYLTIEHKGEFTPEQSQMVGKHLFGCDECLRVCPWNSRNTGDCPLPLASALPDMQDFDLSDEGFKEKFRDSPVLRTKAKGLRRNIEAVRRNLQLPSDSCPLITET
jgi:epoxyqueuosine reductase